MSTLVKVRHVKSGTEKMAHRSTLEQLKTAGYEEVAEEAPRERGHKKTEPKTDPEGGGA